MLDALRPLVDDKAIVTDPATLEPWLTDWRGRWSGKACALLQPSRIEEVRAIVRWAETHGVPLVPQGGNTSMVGGASPDGSGTAAILSLRRMKKQRSIDSATRQVVVEAGAILETLQSRLHDEGLRLPLDLGSRGSATIGGLVSTNAGGTEVLQHGTMGALVVGLEAVLSGGETLDTLTPLKKDNRGPALDRLLVGGEGQFGIVTAVRLQCVPLPSDRATAWVGLGNPQAALDLLRWLEDRVPAIEGFELIPDDTLEAARETFGLQTPLSGQHDWHVLVEAKGDGSPGQLAALLERHLGEAFQAEMAADATIARSEEQSDALWHIRHSLSEAEKKTYGMANSHDVSVPVDAMPAFLDAARERVEAHWPGVSVSGYGHLGDGNIHLHVRAMDHASDAWRTGEGAEIEAFVHDLVTDFGGSISAEHGIGQMKRGEFARLGEPGRLQMLRAVKAALDPHGIFNPGKLL